MSTIESRKFAYWVIGVILALFSAAWVFHEVTDRQQEAERAGVLLESAIALFKDKKYAEALEVFETIPPGSPGEWQARYYQGSTQIMLKDYRSAVPYLEQALALNTKETRIMHALGVAYFKLGNLKMSRAYYASILEIDPGDEEAKGLMDIMVTLERQQPEPAREQDPGAEGAGDSRH